MTTTASDIALVYSGGPTNILATASLGGPPSATRIVSGNINNLFQDITADQSQTGRLDYRCVYFFNDGDTPVFNLKVWILNETGGGANVDLGVTQQNEVQRIIISSSPTVGISPTGGSFTLSYDTFHLVSTYNVDLSVWASNLQNALNHLVDGDGNHLLRQVVVTAQNNGGTITFDVAFNGQDGSISHPLLQVSDNSLTAPLTTISVTVSVLLDGGPINTIAPQLDQDTTPPGGVGFFIPSGQSPITLPKLRPGEGFPFWFARNVAPGTPALASDSLTIRFSMQSLDPLG